MRMSQVDQLKKLILAELQTAVDDIAKNFADGSDYGSHADFRYVQGKSRAYLESMELVNVAYKKLFKEEDDEDDNEGDV